MFFRRIKPVVDTFDEKINSLKALGFTTESDPKGEVRVTRAPYAVVFDQADVKASSMRAGLLIGREIGHLVSAGYQMFFRTESGVMRPARAEQLKGLHDFTEDLKEALGETSLYNEGLGTTTDEHLYDRVQDRDHGVGHRPWEK
jgi:hypothetical protein